MNDGLIVLSLFNGMNTGRVALENIGIKIKKYYSSEIKKYAIKLTQYHYPDTIQLGDINKYEDWEFLKTEKIDLILSGSPCQNLSSVGKRDGIYGEKSSLFFKFVDILNLVKLNNPNVYFFQENVGSATTLDIGIMSRAMGIYPCRINSNLLTAQNRDRYYWCNWKTKNSFFDIITDIPEPKNKNILLKDIIISGEVECEKHFCLIERYFASFNCYKDAKSLSAQKYILSRNKRGFITPIKENGYYRIVNKKEMCRLQGFKDDYCDILTDLEASSLLGDGWTLPIIEHIFHFLKLKINEQKKMQPL